MSKARLFFSTRVVRRVFTAARGSIRKNTFPDLTNQHESGDGRKGKQEIETIRRIDIGRPDIRGRRCSMFVRLMTRPRLRMAELVASVLKSVLLEEIEIERRGAAVLARMRLILSDDSSRTTSQSLDKSTIGGQDKASCTQQETETVFIISRQFPLARCRGN